MHASPLLAVACLLLAGAAAAQAPPAHGRAADATTAEANSSDTSAVALDRQLLVMLRAPPAHFRPDATYGNGYQAAPGHQARKRIVRALARKHDLRLFDEWPMPALGLDCFVLEAASAEARARAIPQLAADPRVESVEPMQRFRMLGAGDPLAGTQPAVARWHLRELHALATGKGITIASIDTGVDTAHPDLRGQVALTRNFVDGNAYRPETHGTEVAGIISARADDRIGIAGIAPRARLLALRACWEQSNADAAICSSFTLAKALQFALGAKPQVLNLSLSGPSDRLLGRLLDVAQAQGIAVVGAVDAQARDGGFPAMHAGVLAIAAMDEETRLPGVLFAPGQGIPAPIPGGHWRLVSGASFAAAQVSGLVALLRELSPGLAPAQLRYALTPDGVGLAPRRTRSIDACAAVARASPHCACDCATVQTAKSTPRR
jgi:subtilisin family serine protease